MPWVCANCHANNSLSHPTCDVCGSDQRLSYERTTPIDTATIAADESTAIELELPRNDGISIPSGILSAIVTSVLCFLCFNVFNPRTSMPFFIPAFIPFILATLMYGRYIILVNLPWIYYWWIEFGRTIQVESHQTTLLVSLIPILIVLSILYLATHECTDTITLKKLSKVALIGVTVGIISMSIAIGDLNWAVGALIINLVMMVVAIYVWWHIMKLIHPNPDLLVMRNLKISK